MIEDEQRRVDGSHRRALGAIAALLALSAVVGSCTWMPDAVNPVEWYKGAKGWVSGDDKQARTANSAVKPMPGADKPFPRLSTVPERPTAEQRQQAAAERERVASTLAADRAEARYTDDVIRRQDETAPPPRPTAGAAVTPAPGITPPAPIAPPPRVTPPVPPAPAAVAAPPVAPPVASPPAPQIARTPAPRTTRRLPGLPSGQRRAPQFAALQFGAPPADIAAGLGGSGAPAARPAQGLGLDAGTATTVFFAAGSARLGAKGRAEVRRAYRAYRARGGTLRVVGHASSRTRDLDPFTHQLVNFNVSVDRANAVARELIRLGAKPEAVRVDAVSDTQPVFFEVMPSGEAGNRRTEIFLER